MSGDTPGWGSGRIFKTLQPALALKRARRIAVAVIGFTLLLVGAAMIVLPGPAVIVIPLGLGILATEFLWAKRILYRFKCRVLADPQACADSAAFSGPVGNRSGPPTPPPLPPRAGPPESSGG
jgi:hypothetical protein